MEGLDRETAGAPADRSAPDRTEAAVRDHLANERTLLAWQRTALGVVAIGFLVDRFALGGSGPTLGGTVLGVGLVIMGAVIAIVGASRFMRTEQQIDTQTYRPSVLAHLVITAAVAAGALAVALFLLTSPA
jgi:putative membrane protein